LSTTAQEVVLPKERLVQGMRVDVSNQEDEEEEEEGSVKPNTPTP